MFIIFLDKHISETPIFQLPSSPVLSFYCNNITSILCCFNYQVNKPYCKILPFSDLFFSECINNYYPSSLLVVYSARGNIYSHGTITKYQIPNCKFLSEKNWINLKATFLWVCCWCTHSVNVTEVMYENKTVGRCCHFEKRK